MNSEKQNRFCRAVSKPVIICVVAITLLFGIQVFAQRLSVIPQQKDYLFDPAPLSGDYSTLLLSNPDRGLRMEAYMDVATGMSVFQYQHMDAIDELYQQAEIYSSDNPQLIQVYFYLSGYQKKDLDDTAFANMNAYFDALDDLGLKAVFRFAYLTDGAASNIQTQEPTVDQIVRHMEQVSDFFVQRQHQIHVYQAGIVGAWGEWDSAARQRYGNEGQQKIMNAILDNTPDDMFIQVRYLNLKNSFVNKNNTVNWDRVGYHDDYLIGDLHGWNTAGNNKNSDSWKQMTRESAHLLVDGEMIWGSANDLGGKSINAILIAQRLQEHYFTSLSMTHGYKEPHRNSTTGTLTFGFYSMSEWQREYINSAILDQNGLRYEDNWFLDEYGNRIPRTMFDYIRDYLGYYLKIEQASAHVKGTQVNVDIDVQNYGFSAPHGLNSFEVVLVDEYGEIADRKTACEMDELQPEETQNISVTLQKPDADKGYMIALHMTADDGTPVRFANNLQYLNGCNIIGTLD